MQALVFQIFQGWRIGRVVEVATDNDAGMGRKSADGLGEALDHKVAVRPCGTFATIATGGMDDKDMQGVARTYFPRYI